MHLNCLTYCILKTIDHNFRFGAPYFKPQEKKTLVIGQFRVQYS